MPEIILLTSGIRPELCRTINRYLGLPEDPSYSFTGETYNIWMGYGGSANALADPNTSKFGDDIPDLYGAHAWCIPGSSFGTLYQVVWPR